jgi:ABC-type glycerol-3-phosphate transport system permease component
MTQATLGPATLAARAELARTERGAWIRKMLGKVVPTAIGLIIFVVLVFPIAWLVDTSFKDAYASRAIPPQYIPLHPTLEVYQAFFAGEAGAATTRELQYWYVMVLNSLYVSITPAILATIIGTLAGYGFARFAFPGGMVLLTVLLLGQMFPGPSLFVPIYFVVTALGLHDNLNALVLVYTAFHVPVATWLMSGFIRTIPLELEEAARIDGASLLQVLLKIVIPLASIGILTVALLGFMAFWGEYGFASIIVETQSKYTATIGLVRQMTTMGVSFNVIGAAATMMAAPMLIFLMLMQKQFVRGLTAGALKDA